MPKKILIVNSNSNPLATKQIEVGLSPYIDSGTAVTFTNPEFGPEGIDTPLDATIAAVETVKVVAANRGKYDAFIVACGVDPGLDACRQIVAEPVVGLAESAMLLACTLGHKFSLIITVEEEIPSVEDLVTRYGLTSRLASVRALELSTAELMDRTTVVDRAVESARRAIKDDRAEVIVLTGSAMVGLEDRLTQAVGVPVITGMVSALKIASALISYGLKTSRAYKYRPLVKKDQLIGYEELQDVYSG